MKYDKKELKNLHHRDQEFLLLCKLMFSSKRRDYIVSKYSKHSFEYEEISEQLRLDTETWAKKYR